MGPKKKETATAQDKPHVLVVDDSRFSQVTTKDMLAKQGYQVHTVASGEDALQYIQEMGLPDVILSDLIMPGMDGKELCEKLRQMHPAAALGLLLITSSGDKQLKQQAMDAGADDFLAKPFLPQEMALRAGLLVELVRNKKEVQRLIKETAQAKTRAGRLEQELALTQQKLKMATSRDDLTGLLTRHAFFTMLEREFKRARRYKNELCLLAIEVDHLATISQSYGFAAVDTVFKELGAIVTASIRDVDFGGRFGLESVGVLLPETPPENAKVVASRMVAMAKEKDIGVGDQSLTISFCVGVGGIKGLDTHDGLLRRAQSALTAAKGQGAGTVIVG